MTSILKIKALSKWRSGAAPSLARRAGAVTVARNGTHSPPNQEPVSPRLPVAAEAPPPVPEAALLGAPQSLPCLPHSPTAAAPRVPRTASGGRPGRPAPPLRGLGPAPPPAGAADTFPVPGAVSRGPCRQRHLPCARGRVPRALLAATPSLCPGPCPAGPAGSDTFPVPGAVSRGPCWP
ncbi:uncharacterized protein LOC131585529 [Poecile atricapillus]|uniref:uncharacterized protein LOC131585529 n=1 Tax=Poecile atricapillus TaxID=48891 RepID=UPI002739BB1D|nr:uncharacterized protein LOC131585529 [Poecile atricapillus]